MSDDLKGQLVLANNGPPVVHRYHITLVPQQPRPTAPTCRNMAEERRLRYADVRQKPCSPFRTDTDSGQVGINLGDPVFRGVYHGKQSHEDDLEQVVQRALDVGCMKLMVTGSDLKESAHAIELAEQFRTQRL